MTPQPLWLQLDKLLARTLKGFKTIVSIQWLSCIIVPCKYASRMLVWCKTDPPLLGLPNVKVDRLLTLTTL